MPLNEQQRQQLDGIVGRMQAEGQDDNTIQFVVDDFKSKYDREAIERSTPAVLGMVTNPAAVAGANVARTAAVRAGEEIATSPLVTKVVKAASGPAAQATARAVGAHAGGLVGYGVGEAITQPAVGRAVEAGIRGGGRLLANVAGSGVARAALGPHVAAASLALEAQPAGETPDEAEAAIHQDIYARKRMHAINAKAGREVVTGTTTKQILASIARYEEKNPAGITPTDTVVREVMRAQRGQK